MANHGRTTTYLLLLTLAGCGSVFTFSKVSREQGIADMEAGKYQEAEGAFADAIRQNPRDYKSHCYLAILYDRQKQYANALAHFKTSLEVQNLTVDGQRDDAFRVKTLTAQADTLAKVPDGDKAITSLESKAAVSRTGEEAFQLARIYAGRGDADGAVAAYNMAAQQGPQTFYIVKAQGLYLLRQGLKPAAETALRQAYRLNPRDADVQTGLRQLGIVPGPSLLDPKQTATPVLPVGPLPDWLNKNRAPSTPAGPASDIPADTKE